MAKVFRINTINSDGSDAEKLIRFEVIDPSTSRPFVDEQGKPCVVIMLKPVSQQKYREFERLHTDRVLNKKTRAMEEITDYAAVQDDLILYAVQNWEGIIGADDKPLEPVADAKLGLPGDLKNELMQRALQGEAVSASSFRATA